MRKNLFSVILLGMLLTAFTLTANAQVEFIIQYDDGNSVYYSGRPDVGDTCGVWFEPPTECQILEGQFQFNGGMGGDAGVFISYLPPDFDPADYYDNNEAGWPGFTPTAVGEIIAGPFTYSFVGGDWEYIVFDEWGYPPEDLDVGLDPFYMGYALLGGGAQVYYPSILGDAADDRPYHSLCYLTDPGGIYPGDSGWWAYGIDWLIRCKVNLYGDPPPMVEGLTDPPDTYLAGPYTISAEITDQAQGGAPGVVTEARLIYSVDGGDEMTVIMTNTGGDTYEGDIPAVGVGEQINFRIEADDDMNHTAIAPSVAGYLFTYRQPSGANILLVNDSGDDEGLPTYVNALEGNSYFYDYWLIDGGSPDDMGYAGSDVFTTDHYSTIIWFNGTANSGSLPDNDADLSMDPIAMYMDDGGNFFLSSSDYLGGAFNPDVWTEFEADPGTFMYEYLKVADGWSDAHLNVGGTSDDTLHFGIEGDPVSGNFTGGIYNHPDPNYNDYCYPNDGETCFLTEIDDESAGIRYDGDYKMVFLPWVLEAADDPDQAEDLLLCVLAYFQENPGPMITMLQGSRYGISMNNYEGHPGDIPHPVRVFLEDEDGIGGATLQASWDGGSWQNMTMNDVGGGEFYVGLWSPPAGWSTLDYRVRATDALGNLSQSDTYNVWTTGVELTDSDWLYCSDMPYEEYYGHPDYDPMMTDAMDAAAFIADYHVWDVDEYGTPDFWTVLNNFQSCFWVGYLDWEATFPMASSDNPFSLYLASGKNLLFSSEEQMGVWTDWVDVTYVAGDFAYDWLHILEIQNDIGYTSVDLASPPDVMTNGMDPNIPLADLQFPPMGDLITPMEWSATYPVMFYGDGWSAGIREEIAQHNSAVLGFCLFQFDQDNLDTFIANVAQYWMQNPGDPIGVEPEEEILPVEYALSQNYPNPFNPITQINFSLPEMTKVELSVYNLMGQEVATLLNRNMSVGHHTVTFDASQLASGVYFYKMKTSSFEQVMKMILVK
jgi:hypothetical protein